ncbi:MAG: hypothetical protein HOO96_16910 [Polyangiaceae bacterium]|nr:hypothetical protein [Polyangiaceae bacterium]
MALSLPFFMFACSTRTQDQSQSQSQSQQSSGCGGGAWSSDVRGAPTKDPNATPPRPDGPAPTGQSWKPVASDEGCGRSGVRWVLVDEVCEDGAGISSTSSLYAPMFRDGAVIGDHLFAVDASHLWSLDLATAGEVHRSALLTGVGQPLAVDRWNQELVLAAGQGGLVLVDPSNPLAPTRSRSLSLPSPAFDLHVQGDDAYVALGAGGVAQVDLAPAAPMLVAHSPMPGFAAGLTTRGKYAFVAGCSTFRVLDLETGAVVSEAWVPNAIQNDRLVAPAKKVTLVGDVAFVAAGHYGAVAIDVSDPLKPQVLGNCTVPGDPAFYASGVRADAGTLYVAGGEWGVLRVDVSSPKMACNRLVAPPPENEPGCSTKPPWEVVPWNVLWDPPPPGKDPVQTLPVNGRLYAFGDARRVGVRAVDVRDTQPDPVTKQLPLLARYDEPRALLGIAASATRVVAIGKAGGAFVPQDGGLVRQSTDPALGGATGLTMLGDGRWATLDASAVHVEGSAKVYPVANATAIVAGVGSEVAVATQSTLHLLDVTTGIPRLFPLAQQAHLPVSLGSDASGIYYAAPEWATSERLAAGVSTAIAAHGAFDATTILDTSLWRTRLPRRYLLGSSAGPVEIAGVGAQVRLVVHEAGGSLRSAALPALTYVGAASDGANVYAVAIDRSLYKSYLVSVRLGAPGSDPVVVATESFTGAASGVAVAGGRVYVADADGFIRIYDVGAGGAATPSRVVPVGGAQ